MILAAFAAALAAGPAAAPAATAPLASVTGSWVNAKGSVTVSIAPCGEEAICGTVEAASDKAKADAARAGTATLVGTQLLEGFRPSGPDRWKGTLFVPDLKRRSKAEIIRVDDDRLRVRGCAVGRMICKSQTWTRVPR